MRLIRIILVCVFSLFLYIDNYSQIQTKPFFFELALGGSIGHEVETGLVDIDKNNVTISFGGGYNFDFRFGYLINEKIEMSILYDYQISHMIPSLSNATGSLECHNFCPIIAYKIRAFDKSFLNIGLGAKFSNTSVFHLDASKMTGGFNNKFYYTTIGPSLIVAYESYFTKSLSLNLSSMLNYNYYKLSRINSNGIDFDLNKLTDLQKRNFDNINGSGFRLSLGLILHL